MAALAIALRIAAAVVADGRIPPGDARNYVVLAQHLIEGRGLVIADHYMGVEVRALYPPVYPILLAAWGVFVHLNRSAEELEPDAMADAKREDDKIQGA